MLRHVGRSVAFVAFVVALAGPASASGLTRIQQSDGSVQVYHGVRVQLAGETLRIVSADRQGVLEITDGACSFVRELQRCLPITVTLHQHGRSHLIPLERGTVFLNLTNTSQTLHHSSEQLPPHSVLVALHTLRGTLVSVRGHLDEAGR